MILVDANLLIYSSIKSTPNHAAAKKWLDDRLNSDAPIGIPWNSIFGFLRIITNPRVFNPPVSPGNAWEVIEYWLDCSPVWIPDATEKHRSVCKRLYASVAPQGNLVTDTHLAALAIEHGLILCSTDRDFTKFPELKWENPISA